MASPTEGPTPPPGYQPPPSDTEVVILACLPVDTSVLEPIIKVGSVIRGPLPTDTPGQCENAECRAKVWIDQYQHYYLTENPEQSVVLCLPCAIRVPLRLRPQEKGAA